MSNLEVKVDVEPEPGEVDKTQLQELINSTVSLDSSLYTPESWADVVAKLADATDLTFNDEATQDEVDLAYSALKWSVDNLVDAVEGPGEVHKESFLQTIEEAQALDSTYYESESWGTLQSALDSALIVYEDEESTEADYYIHQSILLDAMNSLVELKTLLQMALHRVNYELYEYNYSLESWTQLQTDYDYGFGVYENPDATGRMYTLAINRINKAIEELVEEERARPLRLDLLELIDNSEFIYVEELYTPDTFHQLKSKLTDGRIVAEDVETTDEIAQEWIDTIHSKIEALVDSGYELPQNEHLRGIVSAIESIDVDNKLDNDISNQVYFMELTTEHENIESLIAKTKNGTYDETEETFTNYPHRIVAVKVNEGAGQGVQDYLEFLDSFLKDNAESQFPNFLDEASDIRIAIHGDFLFLYTIGTVEQNDEARDIIDSFFSEGGVPTDPTESIRSLIWGIINPGDALMREHYEYTDESLDKLSQALEIARKNWNNEELSYLELLDIYRNLKLAIDNIEVAPDEESLYNFNEGRIEGFNQDYIDKYLDGIQPVNLIFPETYRGKVVETINGGFSNSGIKSIVFQSKLEYIGIYAFKNNEISGSIILPNGLTFLGEQSFSNNLIEEVVFPDSFDYIHGFDNNELTHLDIGENVKKIGDFSNNKITSIDIPGSVVEVVDKAFYNNLISGHIEINENTKKIGSDCFSINNINSIVLHGDINDGVISKKTFYGNNIRELVIPEGITKLSQRSFAKNQISKIVIADSVSSISYNPFDLNSDTFLNSLNAPIVDIYANLLDGDESYGVDGEGGFSHRLRGYEFIDKNTKFILKPLEEYYSPTE